MNVWSLYFDPTGRIKRSTWWLHTTIILVGGFALALAIGFIVGAVGVLAGLSLLEIEDLAELVGWGVAVIAAWCWIALSVKHLHDTDKSAWWMLLSLVPTAGWIWLCMVGFQGSSEWRNRYGDKPK